MLHARRFLTLLLFLCFLGAYASSALAQSSPTLAAAEVDLWPEYDQPSVLVIYRLSLSASSTLPADLVVSLPARVKAPHAVASRQPNGSLLNLPYETEVQGDRLQVRFTATTPDVHIEYYDAALIREGNLRQFTYEWTGDLAVNAMTLQVQQPKGATNMKITPSLGSGISAEDGMMYYSAQVGALPVGQPFALQFEYEKAGDELSVASLPVQPSAPIQTSTSSLLNLQSALPWLLGSLGVLLIVGGGVWYWRSGQEAEQAERRPRRRRANTAAKADAPTTPEGAVYCHNCGKRAGPGDRFCRTCGAALRQA